MICLLLFLCVLNQPEPLPPLPLFFQVRQLQEDAVRLQSAYAGDKADDIQKREGEVSFSLRQR